MNSGKRIPPSKRVRQEIEEIVAGMEAGEGERDIIRELMKKASKMIIQELLEKEVEKYLGRGYYERDKGISEERGYRNGYEGNTIKTEGGKIKIEVPQVKDGKEKYCSRIKEFYKRNTEVLEKLATSLLFFYLFSSLFPFLIPFSFAHPFSSYFIRRCYLNPIFRVDFFCLV